MSPSFHWLRLPALLCRRFSKDFNIQYDGMTVLLSATIQITAGVTNHIKIAIQDIGDALLDSAIFLKAWSICEE